VKVDSYFYIALFKIRINYDRTVRLRAFELFARRLRVYSRESTQTKGNDIKILKSSNPEVMSTTVNKVRHAQQRQLYKNGQVNLSKM
jgi:hypothetical protein